MTDQSQLLIRTATKADLANATELCIRSKAHWGYDAQFMDACREELTLTAATLENHNVIVAERDGSLVGLAELALEGSEAELVKLFIEPEFIGSGIGRRLFALVKNHAIRAGADRLVVTADPDAVPFYVAMGCQHEGEEASGSIPGRVLPVLAMSLDA